MTTAWIDNGKSPDELYNARLGFWLPPDTPYGNFQLKLQNMCERIDEANRRLSESHAFWIQARPLGVSPTNAFQRHTYTNEQAIYLLRRTADEIIALIWCLSEWQTKAVYPQKITIDSIGTLLSQSPDQHLTPFRGHIHMLTVLNEVANAFKHSFVQSDIDVIGRDEPCVHALGLNYNRLSSGIKFHSVSLVWLANAFTVFYKEALDWLRAFSERHRNRPMQSVTER